MEKIDINQHLGLIHSVLKTMPWTYSTITRDNGDVIRVNSNDSSLDYNDLFQEGYFGLVRAAETYDSNKGSFSTNAYLHIKSAIFRAYENTAHSIRKPVFKNQEYREYRKLINDFQVKYGYYPTYNQIAFNLNKTVEQVKKLETYFDDVESLDESLNGCDDITVLESIEDDTFSYDDIEYQIDLKLLRSDLIKFLDDVLNEREAKVIKLSYGIGCKPKSLSQIGELLGFTHQNANSIKEVALRKLRRYSWKIKKKYPGIISYMLEHMDSSALGRNRTLLRETIQEWIRSNNFTYLYLDGHKYEIVNANKFYVAYNDEFGCIQYLDTFQINDYIRHIDGIEFLK